MLRLLSLDALCGMLGAVVEDIRALVVSTAVIVPFNQVVELE